MAEKTASDAPVWYSAEEASAWANGYNAAAPVKQEPVESLDCRDNPDWSCGTCGDRDVPRKFRVFGSCYRCTAQWSLDKRNRRIANLEAELADMRAAYREAVS